MFIVKIVDVDGVVSLKNKIEVKTSDSLRSNAKSFKVVLMYPRHMFRTEKEWLENMVLIENVGVN